MEGEGKQQKGRETPPTLELEINLCIEPRFRSATAEVIAGLHGRLTRYDVQVFNGLSLADDEAFVYGIRMK